MKKIGCILSVLGLLLLALNFLVARGQSGKSDSDSIILKTYFQIDPANPQQKGFVETLQAFEESHPNVQFEHEYATGNGFHQKFQTMAATRQMPDLFTTYVGKRTAYITEAGLAMDLRDFLDEKFQNKFIPETWEQQGKNGEIYTIPPSMAITHVMYSNGTLMEQLGLTFPKTYEELKEQGKIIRAAGYYPISLGNKDQWPINSWLLSLFVHRLGGREEFDKARTGSASFTDSFFVDSLALIRDMVENELFSPGVNQMSNAEADSEFYRGRSVYLIDAAWRVSAMIHILDSQQQAQLGMQVFPSLPNEVTSNSSVAVPSEGFGIGSHLDPNSKKAQMAWQFIRFYNGKEGAEIRLKNGEIPTYKLDYASFDLPKLQLLYADFAGSHSMGYVIDAKMDAEGMSLLNPDIQALMFGDLTPTEVASRYEDWVKEYDSNRLK